MKIGFITPSLHTLGKRWLEDPQIVKLAVPTLSGYLAARGHGDIRQYDFELEIAELARRAPGAIDLGHYFDDALVARYLGGEQGELGPELACILATLGVEAAELFGLSCASALGRYADMHATCNLCLCLCRALKQRWPGCSTVLGGLQISPEPKRRDEYLGSLERCAELDYAVGGCAGELGLYAVVERLEGGPTIEQAWPGSERRGSGVYLPRAGGTAESVEITPWFDPRNVEQRATTGRQLLARYHLDQGWVEALRASLGERVVVLPLVFLEGCNAECAFCGYSMSRLVRRDIGETVRAIASLRDRYGARYFHFLNTNINASLKYAEAFCDALIAADLDILWSDCANLWAMNERLLEKMARSGCIRLTWGIECPSDRMLAYLRKGITVAQAEERLRLAHEIGIWNQALLITGLPTETAEDVRSFVGFLERTAPYLDAYSISPFYLIDSSLMGTFPHRFGLELLPNPTGLLEHAAFREVGGLDWPAKQQQIVESTRIITDTVRRLRRDPKTYGGSVDLELLFWLYRSLGRERKADIVRAYEDAFLVRPSHVGPYLARLRRCLAEPSPAVARGLRRLAARPQPDDVQLRDGGLCLSLRGRGCRAALELKLLGAGGTPPWYTGTGLGASVELRLDLVEVLERLLAPEAALGQALIRAGWQLDLPRPSPGGEAVGFGLRRGQARAELVISPAATEGQLLARVGPLGCAAVLPPGAQALDTRTHRFFGQLGRYLLDRLLPHYLPPTDDRALGELAQALLEQLESDLGSPAGEAA